MASIKNPENPSKSHPRARETGAAAAPPASLRATPLARSSLLPEPRRTKGLSPYSRVCWLYEELKAGHRWNVPGLMKEFAISESSARRDIDHLRVEFQQDITFDPARNSFVLVQPGKPLPHVPVTRGELFMLLMAQEALSAHRDSRFGRTLQAAIDKLSSRLDQRLEGGLAELTKNICFRTMGGAVRHDALVFDTVAEAVGLRRELFFDYLSHKRGKKRGWRGRPRCLVRQDGVWYLLIHQTGSRLPFTLSLSRMSNVRLGEKGFSPEAGPTLRESLASSIGIFYGPTQRVRVRFRGRAARLVGEMCLHDSQDMIPVGKDGLELTMEVAVNGELEHWVLGWGEEATVMEPAALRTRINDRLREAQAAYERPAEPPVARPEAPAAPSLEPA